MKKWKSRSLRRQEEKLTAKQKNPSMKKLIIISFVIVAFFGALILLSRGSGGGNSQDNTNVENITVIDGKQIITLDTKGGYFPKKSTAKAGLPTVLRFKTDGTFDCSSAVRLPSLKISRNLPPSGETDIDIGQPTAGKFGGSCGMGMYFFEIDFQA